MSPIFNYIITIHNKEDLIEHVLNSVVKCCGQHSFIYPVLDGCIDKSEEIVDDVIRKNPQLPIKKIKVNDVHEILSINEGLRQSDQSVDGYNIILQDDVIISDFLIEKKVVLLYEKIGKQLGYLSFRLGANLKKNVLKTGEGSPFRNYIENAFGHGIDKSKMLLPGQFAFRNIAIKSPVCIPTRIIRQFGLLDENLSPCFHDDTEYCLRLLKKGYKNGVFGLEYQSDLEWGGTRRNPNPELQNRIKKNMDYIRQKYRYEISRIISLPQKSEAISIGEFIDAENSEKALHQFKLNKKKRKEYELNELSGLNRIKYYLKRIIDTSQFFG
ncbi:MAG: glycosyltransferase family 2 protein [Ginsengibacter sp.]